MTNYDPDRQAGATDRSTSTRKKDGIAAWLPWLIGAAVLLLVLIFGLRACGSGREETAATTSPAATTVDGTTVGGAPAAPVASGPAVAVEQVTLPGGQVVELAPATLNYELQRYLASSEPAPRRFTFDNLNFATGSATLPANAQATLAALGQIMTAYPNARVRVEGYADARGTDADNQQLGAQRAEAVARALIGAGIAADRVRSATGGETNPVDTNATAEGRAENRRTDLVVLAK